MHSVSDKSKESAVKAPWLALFLTLCPINLVMSLDKQIVGLASPLIAKEMHLSIIQVSVIISAAYWSYALLQVPSGWMVERFGYRNVLFGSLLSWGSITLLTAGAGGFAIFLFVRVALGFGQAPDWPACIVAVKQWFSPEYRPMATGWMLSSLYLAPVFGGPIAMYLMGLRGWRLCLFIYGTIGLVLAAVWWRFAPWEESVATRTTEQASGNFFSAAIAVFRDRQLRLLCICYFLLVGVSSFYSTLYPQYITLGRGYPLLSAGMLLSAPFIGQYLAVLIAGRTADWLIQHMSSRRSVSLLLGLVGSVVATTGMILVLWVPSRWGLGASSVLSMAGCGTLQVMLWSTVQDRTDANTGTATGCISFWGNLATGTVPIMVATIQKRTSDWNQAMILPIAMGCALLFVWGLALGRKDNTPQVFHLVKT